PLWDRRYLDFELPVYTPISNPILENLYRRSQKLKRDYRIGVLVSGGLDSALLYYLMLLENQRTGNKFIITPYTILRKEGSKNYAIKVINHIHNLFLLNHIDLNIVGDNQLEEIQQVESGAKDVLIENDFVYIGIIESRPEHSINWLRGKFTETVRRRYPLLNLQKSHIIDLFYKFNLVSLIPITHSCAVRELVPCLNCNGCNERSWGFKEMKITDTS
ncbi:MAG: hypothetical protein EBU90_09880, partial [Proteobacteria bacterium]|nr:hypothetical protein [Pseudomonadota bacterium]